MIAISTMELHRIILKFLIEYQDYRQDYRQDYQVN